MRLIWNKHGHVESGGIVAHDIVRLLVGVMYLGAASSTEGLFIIFIVNSIVYRRSNCLNM
jgi:hypothetical protein